MKSKSGDFYTHLRDKLTDWTKGGTTKHQFAEYILAAPDLFHLLCKLSLDKDVPTEQKAKLAVALAYFVSPLDVIPEALVGPVGYVDDVGVAAYVLNSVVNSTDPRIVRRHWAGSGDALELIKRILESADQMIGSGLWATLRKIIDRAPTKSSRRRRASPRTATRR